MSLLSYSYLKAQSVFAQTVHGSKKWYRWTFSHVADYEKVQHEFNREYTIPSSTSDRSIRIRVWDPPNIEGTSVPRPVHLNFHPSGYLMSGDFGVDSDFCKLLAEQLGITVLDVDYAKGPEYPFPHAYNEAIDVIKHVVSLATEPNPVYDVAKITMGGFSAGGGLALALPANDEVWARKYIKAVVAIQPWVDVKITPPPPPKPTEGSTAIELTPLHFMLFRTACIQEPYKADEPRISPIYLPDDHLRKWMSEGKQKICVLTGGKDNLEPQGREFAEKLRDAGGDVLYKSIPDVGHYWDKNNRAEGWEADRKAEAYRIVVDFLRSVYAKPVISGFAAQS